MKSWPHRLCIAIALFVGTAAYADPLPHFNDIAQALSIGKQVSVALDIDKCQGKDKNPHKIKGGLTINSYMILKDNSILFSDNHFTLSPLAVSSQQNKPIIEFVRYELDAQQDNLKMSKTTIQLPDYKVTGEAVVFSCKLGSGARFFG